MLLDLWRREGVDAQAVAVDAAAHTGVYFVTHGASGHVFSYLRAGSAASRMRVDDLPLDLIRASSFVQASGISLAISANAADCVLAAFEAARAAGVQVALDSNLRLKLWPLARARAVIGRGDGPGGLLLSEPRRRAGAFGALPITTPTSTGAHRLGARTVLLKLGAEGVGSSATGTRRERGPRIQGRRGSMPRAPAIAFAAAFLARMAGRRHAVGRSALCQCRRCPVHDRIRRGGPAAHAGGGAGRLLAAN